MPLEKLKENAEEIQENVKAAVNSTIEYYKLWGFKVATKATIMVFKMLLLAVFFMMGIAFVSIALALYLGEQYHSNVLGFSMVGGVYFVLGILVYLLKDKIGERTVLKKFSAAFFNEE